MLATSDCLFLASFPDLPEIIIFAIDSPISEVAFGLMTQISFADAASHALSMPLHVVLVCH